MESPSRIVGTCLQMCSDAEIQFREKNGLLHYFEIDHQKNSSKADQSKVIKEFSRSAAGKKLLDAKNLRPSHVLLSTINYLIDCIVPSTELPWSKVYDFVNDRMQAVRQDLIVQVIEDNNAVQILEKCARFYILASYILCEEEQSKFDPHINDQQLAISLERLFSLYEKIESSNTSEFIAIYFIRNILNTEKYFLAIKSFSHYISNKYVKLTILTCNAYMLRNFIKFFRLIKKLPLLFIICFYHNFPLIRNDALKSLNIAFSSSGCQFPINTLSEWLLLPDDKIVEICKQCNLKILEDKINFNKKLFKEVPDKIVNREKLIESKLKLVSLKKLINVN